MGLANQADSRKLSSFQLSEGSLGLELWEDLLARSISLILPNEECTKSFSISFTFKSLSESCTRDIRLAVVLSVDINLLQFLHILG